MADIPASTWSETDASNSTAAPDGFPEGMAPSGINNGARAVMGAVKRWFNWSIPKTTGGTTTAYTLSYSVAPGALVDGMSHLVQFNATCGATPTLNVNSLGAKPIHKYVGGAWGVCAAGDIPANVVARVSYNSGDGTYRITSTPILFGAALLAVANTFSALMTMSGAAINEAKGADIASATTTDIGAATGNFVHITGTTTITGLGTIQAGTRRKVVFDGILTLTHNATSLILPTGANITTAAGDCAEFESEGSGNWRCTSYERKDGTPLKLGASSLSSSGYTAIQGGLYLQWGITGSVGASSNSAITFPLEFPTACYSVTITPAHTSIGEQADDCIGSVSTTGFTLFNQSPSSAGAYYWQAIGK